MSITTESLGFHSWRARGMFVDTNSFHVSFPSAVPVEAVTAENIDDYLKFFFDGRGSQYPAIDK